MSVSQSESHASGNIKAANNKAGNDNPVYDQTDSDNSGALCDLVKEALDKQSPIVIRGGNSKAHLGQSVTDENAGLLDTRTHAGVVNYDPTELVVTVRAGTSLQALVETLDDAGQMMPFEPPVLPGSTIGGVLACGLAGPRRPFTGSARDYVLGARVINGHAQDVSFGGEVMKNVAGYDVSRVQVGAWGTLGVLLDLSMKVLPKPELELTLRQDGNMNELQGFAPLMRQSMPLSGAMLIDKDRYLRLSGSEAAVRVAAGRLGGDIIDDNSIWTAVSDHTHAFFAADQNDDSRQHKTLWRISVADYTPPLDLAGEWLYEWAGGQRWLWTSVSADDVFRVVETAHGHATRYSNSTSDEPAFQPLSDGMRRLQARLRDSFDPLRIFNRGRFHPELDALPQSVASVP